MNENNAYKSGVRGRAEVLFGGKISIAVFGVSGCDDVTGISLSEYLVEGKPGVIPSLPACHDPQVNIYFNNLESVNLLSNALSEVRERLKRNAEKVYMDKYGVILDKRIIDCGLSVRVTNICISNGLETIGDVVRFSRKEWLNLRNAGIVSTKEMDDFIADNGLQW